MECGRSEKGTSHGGSDELARGLTCSGLNTANTVHAPLRRVHRQLLQRHKDIRCDNPEEKPVLVRYCRTEYHPRNCGARVRLSVVPFQFRE